MTFEKRIQIEASSPESVPWTVQDVWFTMTFLVFYVVMEYASAHIVGLTAYKKNIGIYAAFFEIILLIPIIWLVFKKYHASWSALGFRSFKGIAVGMGCGFLVLVYIVNFFLAILLALLKVSPSVNWVTTIQNISSPWWLVMTGVILAPLVEEIFFRGFVFTGLRQRFGWVKAMLISAVVFAIGHMQITNLIPIFLLGCALAYLYQYSKSLWPSILIHMTTNAIGFAVALLLATR